MQNPERLSLEEQNLNIRFAQPQQAQLPRDKRSAPRANSNRSSRVSNSEAMSPHNVRTTQQPIQSESTPIDIDSEVQQLGKKLNEVSRTIDQGGQFLVRKIQFFENQQQQMNLFIFEQKESSAREKIIIEEARAIKTTEEIKQETQRLVQETAKKTAQQSNHLKPKPWH
jgi:hypothetical protein